MIAEARKGGLQSKPAHDVQKKKNKSAIMTRPLLPSTSRLDLQKKLVERWAERASHANKEVQVDQRRRGRRR